MIMTTISERNDVTQKYEWMVFSTKLSENVTRVVGVLRDRRVGREAQCRTGSLGTTDSPGSWEETASPAPSSSPPAAADFAPPDPPATQVPSLRICQSLSADSN